MDGDHIIVEDHCKDGRSAVGRVSWRKDGTVYRRDCINSRGKGKKIRCNFSWPEGGNRAKTILYYSVNFSSGDSWSLGSLFHWRNDWECC